MMNNCFEKTYSAKVKHYEPVKFNADEKEAVSNRQTEYYFH